MIGSAIRQPRKRPHRAGFSLASIFLLTAVVAIVAAAMRGALLDPPSVNREWLPAGVTLGIAVGLLVGLVTGLRQFRRWPGALLGTGTGVLAGAAAGALPAMPGVLPTVVVGSIVILVFAAAVQHGGDKRPKR